MMFGIVWLLPAATPRSEISHRNILMRSDLSMLIQFYSEMYCILVIVEKASRQHSLS